MAIRTTQQKFGKIIREIMSLIIKQAMYRLNTTQKAKFAIDKTGTTQEVHRNVHESEPKVPNSSQPWVEKKQSALD